MPHTSAPLLPTPPAHAAPASAVREAATRWVARRAGGGLSPGEQREFLAWLDAGETHRQAFLEAEALWQDLRALDDVASLHLAEARAYLARERKRTARRGIGLALAATAIFASVLGVVWHADPLSLLRAEALRTAVGQRQATELADGSRLDLDTDSEVIVRYARRAREIHLLRGRAMFTVAHGDDRPFVVHAGRGEIRDIGTRFTVDHRRDRIAVAVLDGAVEVSAAGSAAPTRLGRGQRISYAATGELTPPDSIDVDAEGAWREGRYVFRNQPLGAILAELGRYRHAEITVGGHALMETRVSGSLPTDDLPAALDTLAATLPVRLLRKGPDAWRIEPRH